MNHPIIFDNSSAAVKRVLDPNTPLPAKMMAASGMAPLPPLDLITVIYVLSYDKNEALSKKAIKTLVDLPDKILLGTIESLSHPEILDGIAKHLTSRNKAIEKILLNRKSSDETFEWLAKKVTSEQLLEIIISNEQRLLRTPVIIEKLYFNKHTRMSSVDRAVELAIRNGIELDGIPAFEEAKKALEGELIFEPDAEPTPDDINFNSAVKHADQLKDESIDAINDILDALEDQPNDQSKEKDDVKTGKNKETENKDDSIKKVGNLSSALSTMTISQKIRMAMLGTASQRSVLIRDANKLVIMSVLKSPSVNESEVRKYSALKALPEEAMRFIASKREWTKQYTVKLNLVNNPRTPVEHALRFLNHLRPNDIKTLERSKDVSGVINKAAKELRKKRMK